MPRCILATDVTVISEAILVMMTRRSAVPADEIVCWIGDYNCDM
jgi:hypothetical protein